ncbi:MAG: prolipoprotein diacylglyceryl transferase [Candidatus Magasanikbacteria bacterium]
MIPYFQIDAIQVGPVTLQMWGILVSSGILLAMYLCYRLANRYFLSPTLIFDLGLWAIIGGLIGGRFGHIFFYNFSYYWSRPEEILKFWHGGASSLGGFLGAAIAIVIFVTWRKLKLKDLWPYLDITSLGLWLGWGVGRIGCFFIHDHPGRLSNFFLAVNFPNGARHDLGLYESLVAFLLFTLYSLLFKRLIKIRWGLVFIFSFATYAIARFFLDFLRATDLPYSDPRYFYLTPAQWGMGMLLAGLTIILICSKIMKQKSGTNLDRSYQSIKL